MQLSRAYSLPSPVPFTPTPGVLEDMYYSSAPFNEGLASFEYPLYHATDEELDHFLGSVVSGVARAVGSVAKTAGSVAKSAGKVLSSVEKVIPSQVLTSTLSWTPMGLAVRAGMGALSAAGSGKNVFQGAVRSLASDPVSRFYVDTAAAAARGDNVLRAAKKAAQAGIGDLRQALQYGAMVAPFVPGIGTGVAAALGAANALAAGQPITDALIAAARSAVPGGAVAQMAFDTAVNLARGKNIGDALLNSARSQLPGGPAAQAAFDAALALANGKKIQDAALAATGRLLPASPYAADAMSFVKKVVSGQNIQRAALSTLGNAVFSRIERQAGPILSGAKSARFPVIRRELPEMTLEGGGTRQRSHPAPVNEKVRDVVSVPFRWICKVSIFENGKSRPGSSGTGVLISDRHILTATHVVRDAVQDPYRFQVGVTTSSGEGPFFAAKKPDVSPKYKGDTTLEYDYAIITLSQPVSDKTVRGAKLCFWGSSACGAGTTATPVNPGTLLTEDAETAGFPAKHGGNEMWRFTGILASVPAKTPIMVFTGETTEGQSGSPLWIRQKGQINLVGIVVARGSVNRVIRLTWDMVLQLNQWMLASVKPMPEVSSGSHLIQEVTSPSSTRFAQLVRAGQAATAITEAAKSGQADVNQLTNQVFHARHPELGGHKIRAGEQAFAQEWLQIRTSIVLPTLARMNVGSPGVQTGPIAQPADRPLFLGIDTYGFDGNKIRDWSVAKAQVPISFAIFRSNYGAFKDTIYAKEWPRIKSAGLIGGAYLFLRFPNPEADKKYGPCPAPDKQAHALIDTVGKIDPGDFPPTIDVEFPGGRATTGLSADQCLERVRIAWKILKDYYRAAPIIYTSGRVWYEDLQNRPAPDLVESPLWLAYYPFKKGPVVLSKAAVTRLNPPVPKPWGDSSNWWIHQYQGDALKLPGFATGNVDMNRFNTLVKGAAGDQVKWAQRRLGITVNGLFDAAMETALARFQTSHSLPANPLIDPQTFAYLCLSNP